MNSGTDVHKSKMARVLMALAPKAVNFKLGTYVYEDGSAKVCLEMVSHEGELLHAFTVDCCCPDHTKQALQDGRDIVDEVTRLVEAGGGMVVQMTGPEVGRA